MADILKIGSTPEQKIDPTPVPDATVQQMDDGTTRVTIEKPLEKPSDKPSDKPAVDPLKALETTPATEPVKVDFAKASVEEASKIVTDAGLDMKALAAEYNEGGKLSDETYTKFGEKGIPKEAVDAFINGQVALRDAYDSKLAAAVGGKEQLNDILEWAGQNLTDDEKTSATAALQSMNPQLATLVLSGLQARHKAAVGSEPSFVQAAAAATTPSVKPFGSQQEMVRAMQDKRYKSGDPAYHAQVRARLAISDL